MQTRSISSFSCGRSCTIKPDATSEVRDLLHSGIVECMTRSFTCVEPRSLASLGLPQLTTNFVLSCSRKYHHAITIISPQVLPPRGNYPVASAQPATCDLRTQRKSQLQQALQTGNRRSCRSSTTKRTS